MSANIDKLRELAMGATGGAWRTGSYYDMDGVRRTILIPFSLELPPGMEESDMAYIAAANPDAVLALLDEVEVAHAARRAAQARVAELTALLREAVPHLTAIVRMPNAEWVADAHNKAADALRQALAKTEGDGA